MLRKITGAEVRAYREKHCVGIEEAKRALKKEALLEAISVLSAPYALREILTAIVEEKF